MEMSLAAYALHWALICGGFYCHFLAYYLLHYWDFFFAFLKGPSSALSPRVSCCTPGLPPA